MYIRERKVGRPKWVPQMKDLILYHKLRKRGKKDNEVADELHISLDVFNKNKKIFREYLERRLKNEDLTMDQIKGVKGRSVLDNHPYVKPHILKDFADVGYPISKLCRLLDCDATTFWKYMKRHPKLKRQFELGKEYADIKVMKSLQKRATGMRIPKVKFGVHQGEFIDEKKYWEIIPPDVTAAFSWLINRQGWTRDSETPQHDNKGKILEALDNLTNEITDEELEEYDVEQNENDKL